ncbi:MAG TPA: FGGY-family carbohydrate kinase [Polyangiaceae bacterium]|nr:FGGY-family carbohydrate kinase [Polyangiaceae bacterium]
MPGEAQVLALDLGTSGAKAAVFAASGQVLSTSFHPVALRLLPGGGAEQDPAEWWSALGAASRACVASPEVDRSRIRALAVTAQWSGTVAVGSEGQALHPALIWMDSRGAAQVDALTGSPFGVLPYSIPRLMRWIALTGGAPGKSGKDPLAHILFLREHAPEVYARTRYFLEPKDYLNYRLTGVAAASYDSIALHWVTDNRHIDRVEYDRSLLALTGLDREKLPLLVAPQTELGRLLPRAAEHLGLGSGVRVVVGAPDVHATAIGSGAVRDYSPHLYVGTSTWLSCHLPFKKTDLLHNMASLPAALAGRYLLMNEQECAGACLTQLKDRILSSTQTSNGASAVGAALDGTAQGEALSFADLDALAASAPPGSDKLLFLPWLYGERSPVEDHLLRGGFFNYSLRTTRAHLVRAVLEGIALNARWLAGYTERFAGRSFGPLRLVGGGGKSRLWCQIYADVLDRTVLVCDRPELASLRGAAALAFGTLGEAPAEDFAERVPIVDTLEPRRELRELYDELYSAFVGYYSNNRRWLARLNSFHGGSPLPEGRAHGGS